MFYNQDKQLYIPLFLYLFIVVAVFLLFYIYSRISILMGLWNIITDPHGASIYLHHLIKKNNPQHLLQLSNNLPVRKTKLSYLKTFLAVLMMSAEE
jgi:hypothetical protein